MSVPESFLLALALCADTLAVSSVSGLRYRMSWRRWLLLAVLLAVFQGLFPLLGALIGSACERFIEAVDHWIAFALLLMIGGKMIVDALRSGNSGHEHSDTDLQPSIPTMCLLGVATSIDAFAVGIGFGLESTVAQSIVTCAIIAVVTFLVAATGITLGRAGRIIPERWTGVIAGLVLIAIGAKILLEHLTECP
mgnify:CR=1 FL=1